MLVRRLVSKSHLRSTPNPSAFSTASTEAEISDKASLGRRAAQFLLLGLTAGVAISGASDLLLYYRCSSEAIEKARENKKITEAIGEPIVRGPFYNASLAVNKNKHFVSCTFPVSGPNGTGIFKLKAFQSKDENWLSFLGKSELEILIMDAILNIVSKEGNNETIKISLPDNSGPPTANCKPCNSQACTASEKK